MARKRSRKEEQAIHAKLRKRAGRPRLTSEKTQLLLAKIGRLQRIGSLASKRGQLRVGEGVLTGLQAGEVYARATEDLTRNPIIGAASSRLGRLLGLETAVEVGRTAAGLAVKTGTTIAGGVHGAKQFVKHDLPYSTYKAIKTVKGDFTPILKGEVKKPANKKQRKAQSYHRKIAGKKQIGVKSLLGGKPIKLHLSRSQLNKFNIVPIHDLKGNVIGTMPVPKTPEQILNLSDKETQNMYDVLYGKRK